VYQSNTLIQANYSLRLNEKRLILCAIAELKKVDFSTSKVLVTVGEFKKIFDIKGQSVFENVAETVHRLVRAEPFTVKKSKSDWTEYNWLVSARYEKGAGQFTLDFNPDVIPFLKELSGYVCFSLDEISKFKSSYAIRLFELALQWQKVGAFIEPLEVLKNKIGADKKYVDVSKFISKVLRPAVQEVNKHSKIEISFTTKRTNRKISHFNFRIKTQKQIEKKKGRAELKKLIDAVKC